METKQSTVKNYHSMDKMETANLVRSISPSAEASPPPPANSDDADASTFGVVDLKVITYNVYYKNFDNQATLDAIGNFNADIVALQETNDKFETSIEKHKEIITNFPHRYYAHDKWTMGGSILLSKYKILSFESIERYHKWWYNAFRFLIGIDDNLLQFYHLHLVAPWPPMPGTNICCDDKNTFREKETAFMLRDWKQVCCIETKLLIDNKFNIEKFLQNSKTIQNKTNDKKLNNSNSNDNSKLTVKNEEKKSDNDDDNDNDNKDIPQRLNIEIPTIICGDLNCGNGKCHDYLRNELGFQRTWKEVKTSRFCCCCWHKPFTWKGMLCKCCCCAPKCFDHIYFRGMECIDAQVLKQGESDHWPAYAQFIVPNRLKIL